MIAAIGSSSGSVSRSMSSRACRYVVVDRHRLAYLNVIEKANCMCCSYGNGVIAYVSEIAARTEQYWCPIKPSRCVAAPHG